MTKRYEHTTTTGPAFALRAPEGDGWRLAAAVPFPTHVDTTVIWYWEREVPDVGRAPGYGEPHLACRHTSDRDAPADGGLALCPFCRHYWPAMHTGHWYHPVVP